ncbi:MAG TPA: amidohydrolase [Gemmatimonas sp.]|nr:amidohydrolase [Gemmatimonas sp.]
MTSTALETPRLLDEASTLAPQVVEWRRQLHMHPEEAFHEHETARFIRESLAAVGGLEVTSPTETSVLAVLRGHRPGRTIAVRADIDALPIAEENDVPYRSRIAGSMHACGHDGHTAIALGLATLLARHREHLAGEVRFIFQHAEELAPGGAEELVARGVMDDVEAVIGLHLWSTMPYGSIGLVSGPAMAAPDNFRCTITGKGGHAAAPHDTIDPIVVGAAIVTALQHIVARAVDPLDNVVVSVTQFAAGTALNVIPNTAFLAGTFRTFDASLRVRVPELMARMIHGIAEAHGATAEFTVERGYRPVVNDPMLTDRLAGLVRRTFGDAALAPMRPTMGGEDFSAYQQRAPGVFAFVGAGNGSEGIVHPHHHPQFQIDERSLDLGLRYLTASVVELLG